MITTIDGLQKARQRWLATAGRNPVVFDSVVNVLHAATSNTDIVRALARPEYSVRHIDHPGGADRDTWMILAGDDPIIAYKLHETRLGDAEVAVLPDIPGMVAKSAMVS